MSKEEKHLQTKIRIFEDMLLRCKNFGQAEAIQIDKNESKTTKIVFQENGVLTRALSFLSFGELFLKGWGEWLKIKRSRWWRLLVMNYFV